MGQVQLGRPRDIEHVGLRRSRAFALRATALVSAAASVLAFGNAHAFRFELGPFEGSLNTAVELGLQVRAQDRDSRLVGKANLDPDLCRLSSCQGHTHFDDGVAPNVLGEGPARNQIAADAPGAWSINIDDGNLNFDKGDFTQGLFKAKQDLTLDFSFGGLDFRAFTRYYGHYDFVNYNRAIFHPNIITPEVIANNPDAAAPFNDDDLPNRRTGVGEPAFVQRNDAMQRQIGLDFKLLDLNLNTRVPFIGDREIDLTIGRQLINWGESTYLAVGSLNSFSAINANALLRPAFLDIDEVFQPLGSVSFKTTLFGEVGINGWYGYEWAPVEIPPSGSFFSFIDADTFNSTDSVAINFGKTAEDPNSLAISNQSLLSAVAETGAAAPLLPAKSAKDGDQFGLGMSFYLPNLFTGTELNLYYSQYHSRLPFVSAFAGNIGCLENTVPTGVPALDTANFVNDCPANSVNAVGWAVTYGGDARNDPNGGTAEQDNGRAENPDTYSLPGQGGTAYPLDTIALQIEYPESIEMMGFSFNTAIGDIAFQGEFAYRPNDPLQVSLIDLGFSALQTAFPSGCAADPEACVTNFTAAGYDCVGNPGLCEPGGALDFLDVQLGVAPPVPIPDALAGVIPTGSQLATVTGQEFVGPSYLFEYRGLDSFNDVRPGDYIRGFEEFQTINWILGATYVIGPNNWLFADQIILLFEAGGTHILDLPDISELQIEAPGQYTHASAGTDGTGTDMLDPNLGLVALSQSPDGLANSGLNSVSGGRFNPQQADPNHWTTKNSFGYDLIALIRYESVFPGISFEPRVLIKHDVSGISPGPGERFVQGRQLYQLDIEMRVKNALSWTAGYTWFTGAKDNNVLRDRDFAQVGVRYRF